MSNTTETKAPSSAGAIAFILIRFWALTTGVTTGYFSLSAVVEMVGAFAAHGVPWTPAYTDYQSYVGAGIFITQLGNLALFGSCILAWFRAVSLASWMVKPLRGLEIELGIDAVSLMTIGTALIGLFLFATALPGALSEIYNMALATDDRDGVVSVSVGYNAHAIVQSVLGLAIFASAFRVGVLIKYLRTAGRPDD